MVRNERRVKPVAKSVRELKKREVMDLKSLPPSDVDAELELAFYNTSCEAVLPRYIFYLCHMLVGLMHSRSEPLARYVYSGRSYWCAGDLDSTRGNSGC